MYNESELKYLKRFILVGMKAKIIKIDQISKFFTIISFKIPDDEALYSPSNIISWAPAPVLVDGVPTIILLTRNGITTSSGDSVNTVSFQFLISKVFLSIAYTSNIGKTMKINDCLIRINIANNENHV